ncbi:MAG TPA: DUF1190 domain-containing protein [Beijerinckiaceae bacterium]|jgi:uncharacterized protein YgiB involved in biofilm formation
MKRSQAISLVLIAGAGAVAYGLARSDPSQNEEDALIYRSEQECIEARLRSAAECSEAYAQSRAAALQTAPRYETVSDCERHHGKLGCERASSGVGAGAAFVPLMAAYMIGRTASQNLPIQPLFRHREDEKQQEQASSGGHGGSYCSSSGGRVYAARSGGVSRVSSAVARTTTSRPEVVARGGFGSAAKAVASRTSPSTSVSSHGSSSHGVSSSS